MDLLEAIKTRHSVRKYTDEPIAEGVLSQLREAIAETNAQSGLHIQLVVNEPKAFASGILKYGAFSGVKNYLVMAGPKGKESEEKVGYFGEKIVLLSQTLGLRSCWVGLTYKKVPGAFTLDEGETVHCVISLGYGQTDGVQHALKPAENFFEAQGPVPGWFKAGLEAALLAPTAINQQKFKFTLHGSDIVEAKALSSMAGYTMIDLGIVKCHFEIAAGPANFHWL